MKSEVIESKGNIDTVYPYIGKSNASGIIVLFYAEKKGITLYAVENNSFVGQVLPIWSESAFTKIDSCIIKFDM